MTIIIKNKVYDSRLNTPTHMGTLSFLLFPIIMFFIATLPSLHTLSFAAGWYNEKRLAQIIILILLVVTIIFSHSFQHFILKKLSSLRAKCRLFLIVFFSFSLLSSFISVSPTWAFLELGNYFLLSMLALFIAYSIKYKPFAEKVIIIAFCTTVALYLMAFLASLLAGLSSETIDYHNLLSGFLNRRFLNQFQTISFPIILLAPLYLNAKRKTYLTLSLLAAFWFMLMLVSDGRGTITASILGLILSTLLIPFSRIRWLLHIAFVLALGVLLYLSFDLLLSSYEIVNGDVLRGSTGGRVRIWLELVDVIKDNPILGIGPMHYAIIPHSFTIAHPHNITLQLAVEHGVPATLALVSASAITFSIWLKNQRKSSKQKQSLVPTALTASFIAALVHGHLSGVFVMPLSQLSFVVIVGWMIGISSNNDSSSYTYSTKSRMVLVSLSILSLVALLNGSHTHIISLIKNEPLQAMSTKEHFPAKNASRYWSGTYR